MRNLEDFPVPNDGEITLCEINGRMQCMNYEYANVSTFTTAIDKHPKIHITRDLLHHTGLGDEGRALFLPTDVPFLKQLTQVYAEHGFKEVLHTASLHHKLVISKSALLLLGISRYLRKVQLMLNPSLEYEGAYLINELSQTRNWANSSIKCIAWHLHNSRLAVATSDDSVRIYCNDNSFVPLLRCKQQKNITCLAWRPMSLTEIAVGHENGVIIWYVDFNSLVSRPSVSNTVMLHKVDHQPVTSLAWSPRGNILVSAAARDSNILVWDVELNKTNLLKGSRDCGNILLRWSPAKDKLLSVTNGIVFRIFWENQSVLAKNCYSSLVGPAKICREIFHNDIHANIGVEELKLLKSKHFHCFKDSSPGEMRCKPHFSDKCLRATLKFEDGSEIVFLGCDYKNNSSCTKLMTEMNFPDQFGKNLNRELSVCQHCYEDLCNMKSGIRPVTQKFVNKDVLALVKRDADDEKSTTSTTTIENLHGHGRPKTEPATPGWDETAPPEEGGAAGPPPEGPKQDDHEKTAKTTTKVSEQENKELKCYESAVEDCSPQKGNLYYNCIRSAKVIKTKGCAVCVTVTVIAKDKDTFQLAQCDKNPNGEHCRQMSSDLPAEGEHTVGKGIKEVKCDHCKKDLCNKVTPKSQTTKQELPNLVILIVVTIFLTLI